MMTGCHHPESLMAMANLQESVKKKKLYTTIPGQIDFVPDYTVRLTNAIKLCLKQCPRSAFPSHVIKLNIRLCGIFLVSAAQISI